MVTDSGLCQVETDILCLRMCVCVCVCIYICSMTDWNEWKTEECHECTTSTAKLQMPQFMIATVSFVAVSLGLRQFQAAWFFLDWVCTLIWKYLGLHCRSVIDELWCCRETPGSFAARTYLWSMQCDLASYFERTNSWFPFSLLTAKSL